jgi:CAAX protease family protein
MPNSAPRPRWAEGSAARAAHAVAVWLSLLALLLLSRHVLFPALHGLAAPIYIVLYFGGVLWLFMIRVGRLGVRDLGLTAAGWRREILVGVGGAALITALLVGWIAILDGADAVRELLAQHAAYGPGKRLGFLAMGVFAAIAEEPLFRGYLQPALMARLGAAAGLILTMVMFQIGHYTSWPTMARIGSLAIIGLVFGALRWRHRSLVAPMVAHALVWLVWGNS